MPETITTAKDLCRVYMKTNVPCILWGPPGIGKSQLWRQLADEQNLGFIDIRLPQLDPVDLRGLPAVQNGSTIWARPDFWPQVDRDGERGIMLLDEIGDCGKAMQSAAYQVVLDRCAGPHRISDGWYIAAASNRRQDKANAQAMSSALGTRFAHIEVEADVECFVAYGTRKGLHHYVLGIMRAFPGLLWSMEGANSQTFACPRQWERVAVPEICEASPDMRLRLIRGLVGEGAAITFETALKAMDLPDLDEVLADPKKCPIPTQPASRYAMVSMLAHNAKRSNFDKIMAYAQRKEFGRDFEVCLMIDATKHDNSLVDHKAYGEFAVRHSDITL